MENEAAYVLWDKVQEADCSMCKSIEPFKEHNLTRRAMERGRKKMKQTMNTKQCLYVTIGV